MWAPSFLEVEEVGNKTCEDLVEAVQVQAHQHAGADHDRGGLPGLLPVGEVDLGQLAAALADEPARPAERALRRTGSWACPPAARSRSADLAAPADGCDVPSG